MRKPKISKITGLETISFEGEFKGNDKKTAVLIFHGYGADNKDLASLAHHIPGAQNQSWYFPNGILEVPLSPFMMGRAWFPVDMAAYEKAIREGTFRDFAANRPKGFDEAINRLQEFYFHISDTYDSIYLGGFSQGAMVATELALRNSDEIKGVLIFSGVLVDETNWSRLAKKASSLNYLQSHGAQDPVLSVEGARALHQLLKESGHNGDYFEFHGQHEIPMEYFKKAGHLLSKG